MATADDTHLINCAICFEDKTNKNPRGLPCQHSFCMACLKQWHVTRVQQGKESSASVECPVCRTKANLPVGGIMGLPVDFKVSEVAELMTSRKHDFLCQTCSQDGLSKPMKALCKNCNRRLCEECISRHKKVKHFSSHVILEDLCSLHKNGVEYFCVTCLEKLCTDCVIRADHQEHDISDIDKAEQAAKNIIIKKQRQLDIQVDILQQKVDKKVSVAKRTAETARQGLAGLKAEFDKLFESLVTKHEETHNSAVDEFYKEYRNKCASGRSVSKECASFLRGSKQTNLKKLNEDLNNMLDSTSDKHVLPHALSVEENCCMVDGIEKVKAAISHCIFSCSIRKAPGHSKNGTKPQCVLKVPYRTTPGLQHPNQIRIMADWSAVVGDYSGPARRFTMDGECIKVYQDPPIKAVCVTGDSVIFSEENARFVRKYAPDGRFKDHVMKPPLEEVHAILVYRNEIFILSYYSGIEQRSLKDKTLRKEIIRRSGICSFVRVLCGNSYHFFCTLPENNCVAVFDETGRLLRSIRDSARFRPVDIKPFDNGNLIVADSGEDRIVEFQTDGTFVRELLTVEDGVCHPDDIDYRHPYIWIKQGERASDPALLLYKL